MKFWRTRIYGEMLRKYKIKCTKHKLPKQWKHWIKKAGLHWNSTKHCRERFGKTLFIGCGRHFRVNRYGEFQCSVPSAHFDRWANSVGYTCPVFPQTEAELLSIVTTMIEHTRDMK